MVTATVATLSLAQVPFALDTTFKTNIQSSFVSSILVQPDGKVIVSGQMRFPGEQYDLRLVRLLPNGTLDESFNSSGLGIGQIIPWLDRFYVGSGGQVRRILSNGTLDPTFIAMNSDPLFSSIQGGGYLVFSDGRVVMSGSHLLRDSIRGFVGSHQLIWFTNTGYLDTTRIHRKANGVLYRMVEMPDGKFVIGGNASSYEGSPVSHVFRVHSDGSLDSSFQTGVYWGGIQTLESMDDGRVYVGGTFLMTGQPDTLHLARLLSDGTLDPSFVPPTFGRGQLPNPQGLGMYVAGVDQLPEGRLLITGKFQFADSYERRGICMLDSTGSLLQVFDNHGVWPYVPAQGPVRASLSGIMPYGSDQYIVWGAYHGYGDGEIDDMEQRYISRLHSGGEGPFEPVPVGVDEQRVTNNTFQLYPNPTRDQVTLAYAFTAQIRQAQVRLLDLAGRQLQAHALPGTEGRVLLDTGSLAPGVYLVELRMGGSLVEVRKLVVE